MARIRTVKPEFWGDPKTCRVSLPARLLFLGLLNFSDDEGKQLGSARRILGEVFPNDKSVSMENVAGWLAELEAVNLLARYTVDDVEYVLICGFAAHQRISRPTPSRLPHPSGVTHGSLRADLGSGSRNKDLGSGPAAPPWSGSGVPPIDFVQAQQKRLEAEGA